MSGSAPSVSRMPIRNALNTVDEILRGQHTTDAALATGTIAVPTRTLVKVCAVLGAVYGASLGTFALTHGGDRPVLQLLSSVVKLPLLFLLTLVVTFPSLYVFAALLRSPLGRVGTARLLLVVITIDLAVLASLGPVFAFFAASTESYSFLILLNVVFASIGGVLSLVILQRATAAMFRATDAAGRSGRRLLTVWCVVYGIVGAQMGWLLRPFLGSPDAPFQWLRARESNFFESVFGALRGLFAG